MPSQNEPDSPRRAEPPFFAGIDLGGTNIKAGLVDVTGRRMAYVSVPTEVEHGREVGARRMGEAVREAMCDAGIDPADVARCGLATPGTMDIPAGKLLHPHNLPGWWDFPIRDRVSHHAQLPVTFANDACAAAYGEYWQGSGSELASMVFLTLGTGIGGGIIIGDLSIEGQHSAGAECGHIIIDMEDDARMCGCGQRGHLEGYASATAVIARVHEALDAGQETSLAAARDAGEEITPLLVAEHAEAGDDFAEEIVMETARYLGIGIVTLIATIDPAGVVLGGAMNFGGNESPLGRRFIDRIRREVAARGLPPIVKSLSIDFASLGGDAGYIGAAGMARLEHRSSSSRYN